MNSDTPGKPNASDDGGCIAATSSSGSGDHPLAPALGGDITPDLQPKPDEFEYAGAAIDRDANDYCLDWKGQIPTPGFDWSVYSLVTVEYTDFLPDSQLDEGFAVYVTPFNEHKENHQPDSEPLVPQDLSIGVYSRVDEAVKQAMAYMETVSKLAPGDVLVVKKRVEPSGDISPERANSADGKKYRMPGDPDPDNNPEQTRLEAF